MTYPQHHNTTAQIFLGAILSNRDLLANYKAMPKGLFVEKHDRYLWEKMIELFEKFSYCDYTALISFLGSKEMSDEFQYIFDCAVLCPNPKNHAVYADRLYNDTISHYLRKLSKKTAESLDSSGVDEVMQDLEKNIAKLKQWKQQQKLPDMHANFMSFYEKACAIRDLEDQEPIVTGYKELDSTIGRLLPGQLHIIAARPRMGKSMFALNITANLAKKGKRVLYFSLEMSQEQMIQRLIGIVTGFPSASFDPYKMTDADISRLGELHEQMSKLPITFCYESGITCDQVEQRLVKEKEHGTVDVVIIDHMHIMTAKADLMYQKMTAISNGLKIIAVNQQVPIISLAQLNRTGEGEAPTLASIRDSGAIEQDGETVMFIHRDEDKDCDPTLLKLFLRKNRNGVGYLDINYRVDFDTYRITEIK